MGQQCGLILTKQNSYLVPFYCINLMPRLHEGTMWFGGCTPGMEGDSTLPQVSHVREDCLGGAKRCKELNPIQSVMGHGDLCQQRLVVRQP
eukprot:scaffold87580_cov45-Prasinocladus_malaysianus.AAC.1